MTLKELVTKNRSYRGYDESRIITKEELLEMVDCARLAPSSVNSQPFKYFLAYDKETTAKIQPITKWAKALPDLELPHPGKYPTAFIIICEEMPTDNKVTRFPKDVGIVAQTMLLAAVEMGLGGCMIGNFNPDNLKAALDFPEELQPLLVVAIGKPDEEIVLTQANKGDSIKYYRDENDVHYVPKRKLEDIIYNMTK